MNELSGWENFYVIVGSSAGALIGLQFVVMTLMFEGPIRKGEERAGGAFSTPNVIHFAAVLLLSSVVSAPWRSTDPVALIGGALGLCGLVYAVIVALRMRSQTVYQPVLEDWAFHVALPLAGYLALAAAAPLASASARAAMFVIGGGSLLLLFAGIHNAWDMVTYQVFVRRQERREPEDRGEPP